MPLKGCTKSPIHHASMLAIASQQNPSLEVKTVVKSFFSWTRFLYAVEDLRAMLLFSKDVRWSTLLHDHKASRNPTKNTTLIRKAKRENWTNLGNLLFLTAFWPYFLHLYPSSSISTWLLVWKAYLGFLIFFSYFFLQDFTSFSDLPKPPLLLEMFSTSCPVGTWISVDFNPKNPFGILWPWTLPKTLELSMFDVKPIEAGGGADDEQAKKFW